MTRQETTALLKEMGVRVTGSVSKRTDYLICGDKPSASKVAKAKKLGITIIQLGANEQADA